MNTKEKILLISLHLFSQKGYEATSVSDIAEAVGVTKGALYKHYKNKRAIFESIVQRMYQLDAERVKEYDVADNPPTDAEREESAETPVEAEQKSAEELQTVSLKSIEEFTLAQFFFWTEDAFASDFRKMLALEQFRDEEMSKLYRDCLLEGPVNYMKDIFHQLMQAGVLKENDAELLALEYYAPLYLLIGQFDTGGKREHLMSVLLEHSRKFIERNSVKSPKGKGKLQTVAAPLEEEQMELFPEEKTEQKPPILSKYADPDMLNEIDNWIHKLNE